MERSDSKNLVYVNIVLAACLIAIVIVAAKARFFGGERAPAPAGINLPAPAPVAEPTAMYNIESAKGPSNAPRGQLKDLDEMYRVCPKTVAGDNIIAAWAAMSPEDKVKISEGFDKKITEAKVTLKADPANKKAKALLKVTESLKMLAGQSFNYPIQPGLVKEGQKDAGGGR